MLEDIKSYLKIAGEDLYGNECISQLEHAKQCAMHAESHGADAAMITAALLHDLGHLVDKRFQKGQENAIDRHHEAIGAAYLTRYFSECVTEPIRMHVMAKQYLCATEDGYFENLSPASVRSLELQGGVFSREQAVAFIRTPYAEDAVNLRRWDELAKVPDCETPTLEHFMGFVEKMYISAAA